MRALTNQLNLSKPITFNQMKFDYISFLQDNARQFFDYITVPEVHQRVRFGQFTMNYLYEKFPEIVVPEEYDCFYDDKKVVKLIEYLASLE